MSINEELEDEHPFIWTRPLSECLISEWRKYECLCNPNLKGAKNKQKRVRCFKRVTRAMRTKSSEVTVDDVKQRICSLRIQYMREFRNFETKKATPKLWCFPLLRFIKSADVIKTDIALAAAASLASAKEISLIDHLVNEKLVAEKQSQQKYVWLGEQLDTTLSRISVKELQDEAVWRIQNALKYYSHIDQKATSEERVSEE